MTISTKLLKLDIDKTEENWKVFIKETNHIIVFQNKINQRLECWLRPELSLLTDSTNLFFSVKDNICVQILI